MNRTVRFLMQRIAEILVIVFLIMVMPAVPPHAKFQKSTTLPPVMPLKGKLAINNRLGEVEIWHEDDLFGPEAFAHYNGALYTSVFDEIVRLDDQHHITPVIKFGKPCKGIYQEQICGRPLGMAFDKDGTLYAADAYYGIFKVNIKEDKNSKIVATSEQLVAFDEEIEGVKVKLPNSVAVASNGDIYWTDSSTEFTLQDGIFDLLSDGSGRLIHYNAKTRKNKVLIKDIHFANGVILADDESFVLVAETHTSRIYRYYLKGPKTGTYDVFIEGLPGLPDNLNSDGLDGFLVPLVVTLDKDHPFFFQIVQPFPLFRKFLSRILGLTQLGFQIVQDIYPHEFLERAIHYVGHYKMRELIPLSPSRTTIVRLSKEGVVMDSVHTDAEVIHSISEAHIFKNILYLGSPFNRHIGRIPLNKVGWQDLIQPEQVQQRRAAKPSDTATPKTATSQPKTATPTTTAKPTTTTPKPTTTTPKPTTTASKPTTTTPKPTTTTPKPTTTSPPPTTATPKPATTKPAAAATATPKPAATTATPKPAATTATPKPAAATTTGTPKPTASPTPKATPTVSTPKPATTQSGDKPNVKPPSPPPTTPEVKTPPVKEQSKTVPVKESQQNEKK